MAGTHPTVPGCCKPQCPAWPWALPEIQGQPQLSEHHHPPREGFLPNISSEPTLCQSEPIPPCAVTPIPDQVPLPFPAAPPDPGRGSEVSTQPSPVQAGQSQLSQPGSTGQLLQSLYQLPALLWDCSNSSLSFLCWGHQHWVLFQGQNPLLALLPTALDTTQGMAGFLGWAKLGFRECCNFLGSL